ncbi:DUF429 domain-containing protein [Natrinema caseinilyticum]|uniref:DUF429 domain-containing protein n=1 Tax=Natrinema caseinilyticum TaxID=2961570 RepID=UPI003CCDD89F
MPRCASSRSTAESSSTPKRAPSDSESGFPPSRTSWTNRARRSERLAAKLAEHEDEIGVADVEADDVLDAMALAITACANEDERRTIPEHPPKDQRRLPMQMVYRAESPLEVSR